MSQRTNIAASRRKAPKSTGSSGGAAGSPGFGSLTSAGAAPMGVSHPPHPFTAATRLRYWFDLTLSRGSGAMILWLAAVTAAFVAVAGAGLYVVARHTDVRETASGVSEGIWDALMRTLDPGTVTGDDTAWIFRLLSLAITIVGIFIFSTLIGLISSVIDRLIDDLRKGRGIVVESGHTLILGWSDKAHMLIEELKVANASERNPCIVVLAERDRMQLDDEINTHHRGNLALDLLTGRTALGLAKQLFRRSHGRTRVVCRSGNPSNPADLALVSPTTAANVVILSDGTPDGDARATTTLLSLMSFDRDLGGRSVVVELVDGSNAAALSEATGGRVKTIVSSELVARVAAQVCRQAGLGAVYQELLDFEGCEMYFVDGAKLDGMYWSQVVMAWEACTAIGVILEDGEVVLNPPRSHRVSAAEQVVVIAEDDSEIGVPRRIELTATPPEDVAEREAHTPDPVELLLVGWNGSAAGVLRHLAAGAGPGSRINVAVDPHLVEVTAREIEEAVEGFDVAIQLIDADATRLDEMRRLLQGESWGRVVLLGYRDALSIAEADARTLLSLVHARSILVGDHPSAGASIVAELLDPRSVELGRIANPDDFVVSERLTSLLMAQLAENGGLAPVFEELLDGVGTEIMLVPADLYFDESSAGPTSAPTWRQIVERAGMRGETALGYARIPDVQSHGVTINPSKSETLGDREGLRLVVVR